MKYLLIIFFFVFSNLFAQTSPVGIKLIKHYESFRAKSYLCPASVWTIGYGSTDNIKPRMVITEAQAVQLLMKDLKRFELYVDKKVSRELDWNEFDALTSFTFNVGYRLNDVLVNSINRGKTDAVVYQINKYNKARVKGILKVLAGLTKRRTSETTLYKTAILIF